MSVYVAKVHSKLTFPNNQGGKSDEAYHSKSIFGWYDGLSRW